MAYGLKFTIHLVFEVYRNEDLKLLIISESLLVLGNGSAQISHMFVYVVYVYTCTYKCTYIHICIVYTYIHMHNRPNNLSCHNRKGELQSTDTSAHKQLNADDDVLLARVPKH